MAHRIARIANGNWNLALEELDAGNETGSISTCSSC